MLSSPASPTPTHQLFGDEEQRPQDFAAITTAAIARGAKPRFRRN